VKSTPADNRTADIHEGRGHWGGRKSREFLLQESVIDSCPLSRALIIALVGTAKNSLLQSHPLRSGITRFNALAAELHSSQPIAHGWKIVFIRRKGLSRRVLADRLRALRKFAAIQRYKACSAAIKEFEFQRPLHEGAVSIGFRSLASGVGVLN
jgi:hypothetical protein